MKINAKNKILILFLLLLPLHILFISNTTAKPIDDTSLQDVIDAGKIVVGIEAGYPPFEQRNPDTDEIEGFDPDIMQYIADDIGVSIEWVDVSWSVIFTGLALGNYDCIISAVTITAEREENMDFSRWYYRSAQAVLVNNDNPKNINTIYDINSTSINVGVQGGTTSELYLIDNNIVAVKSSFVTIPLAIEALELGTVDVVLGNHAILLDDMVSDTMKVVDTFNPEDFGIPVQTGSDSLRLRINSILDDLLGVDIDHPETNAYYTASYEEWFGMKPPYPTSSTYYYTIHASCGNNGDINPEGEIKVAEGDRIEFKFTPDSNYMVDSLTVDGTKVEPPSGGSYSSYIFYNVDSDHTIEVDFREVIVEDPFVIPGYSIVSFIIISFAMVSIITVKIHQRRLN